MSEKKEQIEKKIFFLYPQTLIKEEIINILIRNEFESYVIDDHKKLIRLLLKYQSSIVFINIDAVLKESEWEKYIKSLLENKEIKDLKIGILTFNENENIEKKYLKLINFPNSYIKLKLGKEQSARIIIKFLIENKVKGRRRYIRVKCKNKSVASFNINYDNKIKPGIINFISSVGMACIFEDKSLKFDIRAYIQDIQLRLLGSICKVNGFVFGIRSDEDGNNIHVIMFDKISGESKGRIHQFIFKILTEQINNELKN